MLNNRLLIDGRARRGIKGDLRSVNVKVSRDELRVILIYRMRVGGIYLSY